MAPQTWTALSQSGVTEESEVTLSFTFAAPSEAGADALVAYLRLETNYDVDPDHGLVVPGPGGKTAWSVVGRTHSMTLTAEALSAWVEWMVAAGAEYGECRFEGWGAEVVPRRPAVNDPGAQSG